MSADGSKPAFSLPSILSIIAAVVVSLFTGAISGFLLAIVAIILGAIGAVLALSSRFRGGITSTVSVLLGFVGIAAAVVKLVFDLVF